MTVPDDMLAVLRLLSRTSRLLAESIDYERTLVTVAGTALPYLGSWCIVDVVEPGERMRRVAIVHPDPRMREHVRRLQESWPPRRSDPLGLPHAVRSRVTEIIPHVSDELLMEVSANEVNLSDLRTLGIGSVVVVPLIARSTVLGAITFVSADVGHQYSESDLELAEDLAARCALALDNARLYRDMEAARSLGVKLNEQLVVTSVQQQELADEAREANRAKSQFLATLSHEIRTPINAIVGYTELLDLEVAGPMTAKQKEYVIRIQASSQHLIELIDDILDLAKVEAGRMDLKKEALRAADSITAAIELIEPLAASAGVTLSNAASGAPDVYRGDDDRVRQILVILLSNAVKFTERGGNVTVICGTVETPGDEATLDGDAPWAFLRVEDTGIGISATEAATVFEPFVQVDPGKTRKRGGAGLGLAIGLELARRMGGDLTLRSELGQGSTFTLWLPAVRADEDASSRDEALSVE
ncbi:MAG: GAF domain-containing protein [Gemmatimonadetes bacterium]|nr:GAF domain-containing protein [Gemmatimonadota bacterium]